VFVSPTPKKKRMKLELKIPSTDKKEWMGIISEWIKPFDIRICSSYNCNNYESTPYILLTIEGESQQIEAVAKAYGRDVTEVNGTPVWRPVSKKIEIQGY
jgi:hypothetical protein